MSLQHSSGNNTASNIPAILLVGKSGAGKSTLGNLLLGRNEFSVSDSANPSPQECKTALIKINEKTFNIIDASGNATSKEILEQAILQCTCGIQAIIFVMEATRSTEEQKNTIDQTIEFFGQESLNHMIAVFSKCQKAQTINSEQLSNSLTQDQKAFLNRIVNRFIISPNLDIFEADDPIVVNHMAKLKDYIVGIPNFYALEKVRTISNTPAIVLVGKTGAGKSTLGNLLLDRNEFSVSDSAESSHQVCQTALIKINERTFKIVDTPGIFDTEKTNKEILEETAQAILQCVYGIQAIIFVMEATRFTEEQKNTIDQIIKFLGQESLNHMIAVFSKCRKSQTINPEQLSNSLTQDQKAFLNRIDNRFTISPNLDIFEADDPIFTNHMEKLKGYIVGIPNFYTTAVFEKVRVVRERELQEIEERERTDYYEGQRLNAGLNEVKNIVLGEEACFAADSKVILQNGKVAKISEVVIGDYVCCGFENGKQVFSEVFLIIHANQNTMTEFQLIDFVKQDGSQGTLCITPEHHIFVNDGETDFAKNIMPNKTRLFVSDGEKLVSVTPIHMMQERKKGYYSPLTRSGTILVDDVLCSCYASAPPYQALFNLALAPLRIYTKIFPSKHLDKEIHPYVKFLNRGRWIVEFLDYLNVSQIFS